MRRKKFNLPAALLLGLFAAGFIFSTARAQDQESQKKLKDEGSTANERGVGNRPDPQAVGNITTEETEVPKQGKNEKDNKGQINAAAHRSAVATFVKNLLLIADREGGIGSQVREVARVQNESREKEAAEIEAVESRSKVKTFFFGSDYKNLGALRSDMVKTGNQIEQLGRLAEKTESPESRAELENQIQALSLEQANIQKFIADNESRFSLLGWAVKLFQ